MPRFFLTLAIAALPMLAHAHNSLNYLYDPVTKNHCCGMIHTCDRQPAGAIKEVAKGFLVTETQEIIPHARVIWESPDDHWWRCKNDGSRVLGDDERKKTRCLIGPPRGM